MSEPRLGYVNVTVSDIDRSVAFFRDTVGLPLNFADAQFGYASFATRGASFAVVQAPDGEAAGRHTGVGFVVDDLDAAHAELVEKGVAFTRPPTREPWGGYMAIFTDPDGNTYYLDQVPADHG